MADGVIQLPADGSGKFMRTTTLTVGGNLVHQEWFVAANSAGIEIFTQAQPAFVALAQSAGVSAIQAGTWTVQQGGAPWSVSGSGTFTVNQLTSVGVSATIVGQPISVSQSGTWNINALLSSAGVSASQAGTWTVQQGSPPWSVSGSGTFTVNQATSVGVSATIVSPLDTGLRQLIVTQGSGGNSLNPWVVRGNLTNNSSVVTNEMVGVLPAFAVEIPPALTENTNALLFVSRAGSLRTYPTASSGRILEFAVVNEGVTGDRTIVSADSSNRIKVVSYALVADRNTYVRWNSGTTPISGPMMFSSSGGISFPGTYPSVAFQTALNQALVLNIQATASVGGHVAFYREP